MINKTLFVVPVFLFSMSTSIVQAEKAAVDCSTAKNDLSHLQHEKKSTDERKVKGVLSILPIGIVINAVTSDEKKNESQEMHIDEYNKKIDERIAEIKAACGDKPTSAGEQASEHM